MRIFAAAVSAAILMGITPATAADLISFTDENPVVNTQAGGSLQTVNVARSWTQTVATSNVTVAALVHGIDPGVGRWWITDALGAGANASNVLYQGAFSIPMLDVFADFDTQPRTQLATGLSFAPGTYFLVLDGPDETRSAWVGRTGPATSISLAPGFTLGSTFFASSLQQFAPSAVFSTIVGPAQLYFDLDGAVVPEPSTWALLIAGFGLVGASLRRRPATA